MKKSYSKSILLLLAATVALSFSKPNGGFQFEEKPYEQADTVIHISGNEPNGLNLNKPDGELPLLPEAMNIQLLRTTRDAPELADGDGWTYAHHMDLAEWKGRMYAAWNMTLKDEDVPPSKVVYSTSENGIEWTKPTDLFPRELAWACRFYFYHTKNDKMLAFCAARVGEGNVSEALKTVLLVREIKASHELGDVFTLVGPSEKMPPYFEKSADTGFVSACREAVNCNMLLEQQDYGMFLGDRKMEWHEKTKPNKGWKFGKAFCFYQRADQKWIGLSKMGFATLSGDGGKTWSEPQLPPTLTAGSAKVWGQRTHDNQYILCYNPDPKKEKRFPLVLVHGADGVNFQDMRVVHGEFPPMRYPGKYKDFGYQYVRGVPAWSSDGTFSDKQSLWVIYSVHKEDIWLSRIPLPLKTDATPCSNEDFQKMEPGAVIPGWNIYSPSWASVKVVKENDNPRNQCLCLTDANPTDYARALKLFPSGESVTAVFSLKAKQTSEPMETEIQDEKGKPVLTIVLTKRGTIKAVSGNYETELGTYSSDRWLTFKIEMDAAKKTVNIRYLRKTFQLEKENKNADKLQRLVFRTGAHRNLGDTDKLNGRKDIPEENTSVFYIDNVSVKSK